VEDFKYLGVILNEDDDNQTDLRERIKNANKTHFMLQILFKFFPPYLCTCKITTATG
jgi:hypothetical protein